MKFEYTVNYAGTYYEPGEEVPVEEQVEEPGEEAPQTEKKVTRRRKASE